MRARILASLLLLVLIGIPALIYYYFFTMHVSKITIELGSGQIARVRLEGRSDLADWFPLVNNVLRYEQECFEMCVFSPIPPALYTMMIESEGMRKIENTFSITTDEDKIFAYTLTADIALIPISLPERQSNDALVLLTEDIVRNLGDAYTLIGDDYTGRIWMSRILGDNTQVGIYSSGRFVPFMNTSVAFRSLRVDPYNGTIIGEYGGNTLLFSGDMKHVLDTNLPFSVQYASPTFEGWHVMTTDGIEYDIIDKNPITNIRFTQWLDIDQRYRVGYISRDDTDRLTLSNYPLGISQIVLIDRTNGRSYDIASGYDVEYMFIFDGVPILKLRDGEFVTFSLPTDF